MAGGTAAAMLGPWGDGFADDGFAAACAVADWDNCSPDEYVLLFPRLVPVDGRLPAPLLNHLEACMSARSTRLARFASGVRVAARGERAWFPDGGAASRLLRGLGLRRTPPERLAAERRLLAFLEEIFAEVRCGSAPPWSEDREAWFAFGSGIHPAYLWPESAASPDRGLTAAWLGHLDRGRPALMPETVADYLLDAVLGDPSDPPRGRDRTLVAMVGTVGDTRRLRRAAAARLAGRDPVVCLGCGRERAPLRFPRRTALQTGPRAALKGEAFEHA